MSNAHYVDKNGMTEYEYRVGFAKRRVITLQQAMGGKCVLCGIDRLCTLAFHHLNPTTKDGKFRWGYMGLEMAVEEARKCVLLCHNCHSIHHVEGLAIPSSVVESSLAANKPRLDALLK